MHHLRTSSENICVSNSPPQTQNAHSLLNRFSENSVVLKRDRLLQLLLTIQARDDNKCFKLWMCRFHSQFHTAVSHYTTALSATLAIRGCKPTLYAIICEMGQSTCQNFYRQDYTVTSSFDTVMR
jgi:hypothetical protein